MPKEQDSTNAAVWAVISRHCNQGSVAKVPKGQQQLDEIERRLTALSSDMATLGAAVTPVSVQVALDIDADAYNRWLNAMSSTRDDKGNPVNISLDKADNLDEAEKAYIRERSQIIKKHLQQGEMLASTIAQTKDNRENGGSLFVLQNVYGYGQDKAKDQVTFSLEDMLEAAAAIKERRKQAGKADKA